METDAGLALVGGCAKVFSDRNFDENYEVEVQVQESNYEVYLFNYLCSPSLLLGPGELVRKVAEAGLSFGAGGGG